MALGVTVKAYAEETGAITGKKLRNASAREVELFNADLENIAAQYGMEAIRAAINEYQGEVWILVRQVMQQANAPYGGAGALGDEICMRALRPIDVGIGLVGYSEIWDVDWSALDPTSTVADRQKIRINSDTSAADAMGEEEGNIIFGALNEAGSNRVVNAYRWEKGGKAYPSLTLPFTYCNTEVAQFVKFQAPIIQFTEESLILYMNVVRPAFVYMALVGIHATRASDVATTYV